MKLLTVNVPADVHLWLQHAPCGPILEEPDMYAALDCLKQEMNGTPFDALLAWFSERDIARAVQFARLVRRAHKILPCIGVGICVRDPTRRAEFLDAGGDDFLFTPVHGDELLASIRASVRRAHGQGTSIVRFAGDDGFIDLHTRRLVVKGGDVVLTSHEYAVLEVLALSFGRSLPREKILQHVYRCVDYPVNGQIADVFVSRIRKKLRDREAGLERHIETKRGYGFALVPK